MNLNKRSHHFLNYYYDYYFHALLISFFESAEIDRGKDGVRYFFNPIGQIMHFYI